MPRENQSLNATISDTMQPGSQAPTLGRRLAQLCDHRFAWVVFALTALAACIRVAILEEYLRENPFAAFPTLDGELYWNRAGEMAAGKWFDGSPFHIAPLYAYLLGALRTAGGNLPALYVIQLALHLATAAGIGVATRFRFGSLAGCIATALFLALAEPALFATRVLGTTLQLLLVTALWYDWARLATTATPSKIHIARVGALIGLLGLAFPAAMLLAPVYAVWLLTSGEDQRSHFARMAVGAAAAAAVIGVATLHNAVVSGGFIPITSHAGITLAAGNGPDSIGIFTPLAETRDNVKDQARESAIAFERSTGRSGTWQEIDRHYRNRVIRWWLSNPLDATVLFARKAWWFATSRHYDNVTSFEFERRHGLLQRSAWLPLETPWILGLAVLGAAIAWPRTRRFTPEISLAALPFVVCLAFMYSARYRAVALPVLCGLAGFAIAYWRSVPKPRTALCAALTIPVLLLAINSVTGFTSLDFMRADFAELLADRHLQAARGLQQQGDLSGAESQFEHAALAAPQRSDPMRELAALQLGDGRPVEARASALIAVRNDRADEVAHRILYDAQILSDDYRNAEITLNLIELLAPSDGAIQLAMAWFYAACPADSLRNAARSLHHANAASRILGPDDPNALMAIGLSEAANGRFEVAAAAADRGIAVASARNDTPLRSDFEALKQHFAGRRSVASRPHLLTPEP